MFFKTCFSTLVLYTCTSVLLIGYKDFEGVLLHCIVTLQLISELFWSSRGRRGTYALQAVYAACLLLPEETVSEAFYENYRDAIEKGLSD